MSERVKEGKGDGLLGAYRGGGSRGVQRRVKGRAFRKIRGLNRHLNVCMHTDQTISLWSQYIPPPIFD